MIPNDMEIPCHGCPACQKRAESESKVKPISPQEAQTQYSVPDFVIEAVNELLIERLGDKRYLMLKLGEVRNAIIKHSSTDAFDKRWLDFEPLFQKSGWKVSYDGPGYNESYEGFYEFEY